MSSSFDPKQLLGFREWADGFELPPDEFDYLMNNLGIASGVMFADLIFPTWIEVRGCVLRESQYEQQNFEQWWETTNGTVPAVEAVINHLHLWDLFEPKDDIDYRALEVLAPKVAFGWHCSAKQQFPDRDFEAEVTDDYGPTIEITTKIA